MVHTLTEFWKDFISHVKNKQSRIIPPAFGINVKVVIQDISDSTKFHSAVLDLGYFRHCNVILCNPNHLTCILFIPR